jgi:hypothetical protein
MGPVHPETPDGGPQGYFVMDKDEQYWAFDPRTKTATTKIDPPRL